MPLLVPRRSHRLDRHLTIRRERPGVEDAGESTLALRTGARGLRRLTDDMSTDIG